MPEGGMLTPCPLVPDVPLKQRAGRNEVRANSRVAGDTSHGESPGPLTKAQVAAEFRAVTRGSDRRTGCRLGRYIPDPSW